MKKIIFAALMVLMFAGCGVIGDYQAEVSTEVPIESMVVGQPGVQSFVTFADINVLKSTVQGLKVQRFQYQVLENTGGAGTINLTIEDVGTPCNMAIPYATIEVTEGQSMDAPATLQAASAIDKINERLSTGGRLCLEIAQVPDVAGDIMQMNIKLKIITTISAVVGN